MKQWIYCLQEAWNSLKRKPGFVGSVIITMGLTLGALLSVLTLAYWIWVEPLPYPEQNRLFKVAHITGDTQGSHSADWFTYPGLIDLYKKQDVFSKTALLNYEQEVVTSHAEQPTLFTTYTTPETFSLMNMNMHLGRAFESTESLNTHNPVVILSYDTWLGDFDGSTNILSKTITIRGINFRVVGVTSKHFIEPQLFDRNRITGIWLPWDFNAKKRFENLWFDITELAFIGLLKPDVIESIAEQKLTPLVNDTWQENVSDMPFFDGWSTTIELNSFKRVIAGASQPPLVLTIFGILGLVMIAATNISNLFISRTAQKSHTFSIRVALGAKSHSLYQHLLAESFLLMSASVLLGLIVTATSFYLLRAYFAELIPRSNELSISVITLVLAILTTTLMSALFAWLNYRVLSIKTLGESLQKSGKGTSIQVSKTVRQMLIGIQVSITTILIFITANLSQQAMLTISQANDLEIKQSAHLHFMSKTTAGLSSDEIETDMREIKSLLLNHPAVTNVTQSESAIHQLGQWAMTNLKNNQRHVVRSKGVAPNYFSFYAQKLIKGRLFNQQDVTDNQSVLVVNQAFAKLLSTNGDPIGMRFSAAGRPSIQIIGVVEDIRQPGEIGVLPTAYPLLAYDALEFTVKVSAHQSLERRQIINLLEDNNSRYTLFKFEPLQAVKRQLLFGQYTTVIMALSLALLTMLLAGLGLYGIFSYSTQVRRFEIGTRLAIGAKSKNIIKLVFKDNIPVIFVGIGIGATVISTTYLIISSSAFTIQHGPLLPLSLGTVLVISLLSFCACYWPLRKYIHSPIVNSIRGSD